MSVSHLHFMKITGYPADVFRTRVRSALDGDSSQKMSMNVIKEFAT
jgi:hypothetical protein